MAEDAPSGGGGGFASDMQRKIGPLPMWAWLGGSIVVGAVALLWMQNRKSSDDTTTQPDTPNNYYIPGRSQDEIDEGRYQALLAMIRDLQGKVSEPGDPPDPDPDPGTNEPDLLPSPTGLRELAPGNWDKSVHLGWNAVNGNKGYKLREVNGKAPTVELAEGAWQHIYDQILQPGTAYTFVISTKNSAGKFGPESLPFTTAKTKSK